MPIRFLDRRRTPKHRAAPAHRLALVAIVILGACDLPLDPPVWTTEWTLDLVRETRATVDLLPSGVTTDGSGFTIDPVSRSDSVSLGDVCEACTCFSGPVPALDIAPRDWRLPAPGGLSAAHLTGGEATLVLRNDVGFDLLRRADGAMGHLLVELVDTRSGSVLDAVTVVQSFPVGDSLEVRFGLDGLELQQNLVARVSGRLPGSGCDAVALDEGPTIGIGLSIQGARADSVFVLLSDHAVRATTRTVDVPDWLGDRLRVGDARLTLEVLARNGVQAEIEVELSVARALDALFGETSALTTPFLVAAGGASGATSSARPYVVDVGALAGTDALSIGMRSRVIGSRRVRLTGGETLEYRVVLRAEVPNR